MPPPRRDLGPTEVEEEVLVPGPAARLHGATVEAASVARQTLRSGKNLQFAIAKDFDDLPEGSPVRHNPVRNVSPNLAPLDHSPQAAQATCFTLHLQIIRFSFSFTDNLLCGSSEDHLHTASNPVPLCIRSD